MPKYTEKKRASNEKWNAANLDRISVVVAKGDKDKIKAHAQERGETINKFIGRAIKEQMIRDKGETDER